MKFILILAALSFSEHTYATSAEEVKEKASNTAQAAKEYTKEQKEAFVKEMEDNISILKKQIKKMKERAGRSKDETVEKLEKEQSTLEKDLAEMKKSSGKAWEILKTGVSKAWLEVKTSMSEARDELKK